MANLRIISDNAANRAVIAASSTAGTLAAANLLSDIKSDVWRAAGTSATLTATWPGAELFGCVALPFCNLTSTATIRVRGYAELGDAAPLFDTGAVVACAHQALGMWDWGMEPLGVNAFAFGGGAYGRAWFAHAWARQLVIDIDDPLNQAGYVEASRLVAGAYWSPEHNADYGASVTPSDASTHYRTDAGDLMTDLGPRSDKLSISLSNLAPADRAKFMAILRGNGKSRPVFLSVFPESGDPLLEQDHQLYGKLPDIAAVSTPYFNTYATSVTLEGI